jgi:hypothetical protein
MEAHMRYAILIAALTWASAVMAQDGLETDVVVPETDASLDIDLSDTDAHAETAPKSSEIKPKMKVGKGMSLGVGTMDPDTALPDGSAANVEPPDDKFDLEDPAGGVKLKKSF